ncbi:hypothetical protein [Pseudoduganella albidiflava]|uniref:Uncharacterized protein n=1 Tax=Pseudoduganella albidiflava TaxID=321983 RepID=A0A411X2S8_9BURK|nr:hypothetical protein [Pseudoduganella albidiflava]QBI03311.1 hypothetical protein EYF70_22640 [Pseudoduganella albidiflava]GGY67822.1 hypothetical protein GCM10007387_57500 [Pseudoduganella albidiflava]
MTGPAALRTWEEIEKHNRMLLRALQTAHPVLHNGLQRFIHTLTFCGSGSSIDTVVYLRGHPGEVPAEELTLDTRHSPTGQIQAHADTKAQATTQSTTGEEP